MLALRTNLPHAQAFTWFNCKCLTVRLSMDFIFYFSFYLQLDGPYASRESFVSPSHSVPTSSCRKTHTPTGLCSQTNHQEGGPAIKQANKIKTIEQTLSLFCFFKFSRLSWNLISCFTWPGLDKLDGCLQWLEA